MIRIIISGSREFNNYNYLRATLKQYIITNHYDPAKIEIISGGARGTDSLAIRFANEYNIQYKIIYPDWNTYGRSAGMKRNSIMLDYATNNSADISVLIAFWNGYSRGTKHMIDISNTRGIKVCTILFNN